MTEKEIKYKIGFTSGALLLKEAIPFVEAVQNGIITLNDTSNVNSHIIPINSESSRKRTLRELKTRFRSIDGEMLEMFIGDETETKKLILFYAACKTYPIIVDFMHDVVLDRWQQMKYELTSEDFAIYLNKKADASGAEILNSQISIAKAGQVILRMFRELGLLNKNEIVGKHFSSNVLSSIKRKGDGWFLEILLLSPNEIKQL